MSTRTTALEPVQVSLSRALRLAKRLKGQIGAVTGKIQEANSTQEGNEARNVREMMGQRSLMVTALVNLKLALSTANHSNGGEGQKLILAISETKGEIAMLEGMDTKHGDFNEGYRTERAVKYTAQIRETERDADVLRLQATLEELQEKLESFNARNTITVDGRVVTLQWGTETQPAA